MAGSSVKIKANDVLATWKILVALGLAPCLYIFYSVIGTIFIHKLGILLPYSVPNWLTFLIFYGWSVLTTYASLRIGEIGVDYYKSLKPLMYSVLSHHLDIIQIKELKDQRKRLAEQVTEFCNTHGPKLFDDYGKFYNDYNNIPDDDYYNSEEDSELEEPKDKIGLRTSPGSDQRFHPLNYLGDVPIFSHQDDEDVSEKNEVFEVKTKENIDDNKGDSVVRQRKTKKVA